MTITKQIIIMSQKPYFAPEAELLELNPTAVFCGSPDLNSSTGEGYGAWETDN